MKIFKNLLLIIILISCTPKDHANINAVCPCIVTKIEISDKIYKVKFIEVNPKYNGYSKNTFSFSTSHKYNLRDTIK